MKVGYKPNPSLRSLSSLSIRSQCICVRVDVVVLATKDEPTTDMVTRDEVDIFFLLRFMVMVENKAQIHYDKQNTYN